MLPWIQLQYDRVKQSCTRYPVQAAVFLLSLPLIVWLGWNSINFYSYQRVYTDAGVFMAVANHIADDRTLYVEIWDHKPPVIYYLSLIPLYFGDGSINAVRYFERIVIILGMLAFYFSACFIFKKPLLSLVCTFGFHYIFFTPELFQGGHFTEEYAVFFILTGITAIAGKPYVPENRQRVLYYFSGLCFALAVLTKEPFLLSAIPWLLYVFFEPKLDWKQRIQNWFCLCLGGGSLLVVFVFYVWLEGALYEWWQVILYNAAYVEYSNESTEMDPLHYLVWMGKQFYHYYIHLSPVWFAMFCVGVASAFYLPFAIRYRLLPVVFVLQVLFEVISSGMSGFDLGHYYLQYAASYCFVCLCGFVFILYWLQRVKSAEYILTAMFLTVFVLVDQSQVALYRHRMSVPFREVEAGVISKYLNEAKGEDDTLWTNLGEYSKYYAETGMLSPCPYIYAYEHLFIDSGNTTAQQKRDNLTACLQANPPDYMILSEKSLQELEKVKLIALEEWIRQNYEPNYDVMENGTMIYELKDSDE